MATPEQTQAILQQLGQSNPEFAATPPAFQQQFVAALANAGSPRAQAQQIAALQQQYPQYIKNESLWKNKAFLIGLAALTGGVAYGALAAPAAAGAGGGTTLGAVGPLSADEAFTAGSVAGPGIAGIEGGTAGLGTVAAGTGFGAALKAALPTIIGAGASLGGAAIASKGNTDAAKIAAAANDRALAQAKAIYEQNVARQDPYVQSGYGSLNALNVGLGLPTVTTPGPYKPSSASAPASTINGQTFPGAPQVPTGTLSALKQAAQGGGPAANLAQQSADKIAQAQQIVNQQYGASGSSVKMRSPNGLVYLVPSDHVPAAQQAGGVLV